MVNINASTDIFALAYQYSSPTAPRSPVDTFLAGGRDGTVRLYDTRSRIAWRKKSGGQIMVQLGSPVCHVKMLDESGVSFVVNGLKKTAVFDLRFPHAPSPMRAYAQETKEVVVIGDADGGGGGSARGRRPQGKSMIDLGFDADPVRGVAAIAEEDEGGRVGLWSLRTGQRLRTLEGGEGKSGGICKGLQFDHTSEKSGLWASHGGVVEWWGI